MSQLKIDTREIAARHLADSIIAALGRFIPDACRRDAHEELGKMAYDHGLEITSIAQRQEYEEMKRLTLDSSPLRGLDR